MPAWTDSELEEIGGTEEVRLASFRKDGVERKRVIIWIVRVGNDLFVRSVKGRTGWWFRGTQSRHEGRLYAGSLAKEVNFVEENEADVNEKIDAAYRVKYSRYAENIIGSVTNEAARSATIRLTPR